MHSSEAPCFSSFIGGETLRPDGSRVDLIDPATGEPWARSSIDPASVDLAVTSALAAFRGWASTLPSERAAYLRRLGDLIATHAKELGELESLANGKSHAATTAEMRAASQWYHFYASATETRDDVHRWVSQTVDACILREPLGVVVAITPFNGALSLGSWEIAPALATGNTVILKPPADAPASSLRLAALAIEAGFARGVINVVIGDAEVSEALALHKGVAMVSFTGSTATARLLAAKVAAEMKRFVCEAGGKSAHIIFDDADLDSAVIAATQGAFSASGQTCVAGSRLLVHDSLHDSFLDRFVASTKRIRLGPPGEATSHIGPVASRRQLDRIRAFVDEAVVGGGRIVLGGTRPHFDAPYQRELSG